jgi:hypothetical protein
MTSHLRTSTLAAVCVGLLGAPANAAVFAVIGSDTGVVTVMDPATVDVAGATRRAWSVSVKRSLVAEGPPQPGYVRMLNEYDCAQQRLRWKTFSVYSRFGALVMKKDNADDGWSVPTPDSEGETGLKVACNADPGRGAIAAKSVSQVVIGLMQAWDAEAPMPPLQTVQAPAKKKPAPRDRRTGRR